MSLNNKKTLPDTFKDVFQCLYRNIKQNIYEMMSTILRNKKGLFAFGFVSIVASIIFFVPNLVQAQVLQVGADLVTALLGGKIEQGSWVVFTILTPMAESFWVFTSFLLWVSSILLDFVVTNTVIHMAQYIDGVNGVGGIGGIRVAWSVIRDVMNMVFIFLLLYVSITTILRLSGNTRSLITKLIIAGLLVNFSFFFTRVIIDASNILANEFYQGLTAIGGLDDSAGTNPLVGGTSVSIAFMKPLALASFYNFAGADGLDVSDGFLSNLRRLTQPQKFMTMAIMGSTLTLTLAFIFFLMSMLLVIRFVMFVLLMVLSPVAFVAWAVPGTSRWARKWWSALFDQAFFAPILFGMLLVSAVIVNSDGIRGLITPSGLPVDQAGSFQATFSGVFLGVENSISLFLNFFIVVVLLIASIGIAKSMASNGAGGAVARASKIAGGVTFGISKRLGGAFGRQTVGRAGRFAGEKYDRAVATFRDAPEIQRFAQRFDSTKLGRGLKGVAGAAAGVTDRKLRAGLQAVESTKFGGKQNLADVEKEKKARDRDIQRVSQEIQTEEKIKNGQDAFNDMVDPNTETPYDPDNDQIKDLYKTVSKFTDAKLKDMIENELDTLKDIAVASALTSKQIGTLNKAVDDGLLSEQDKNAILDARERGLNTRLEAATFAGVPHEEIQKLVSDKKPKEVAALPTKILTDPRIASSLNVSTLSHIAREGDLEESERKKIVDSILRAADGRPYSVTDSNGNTSTITPTPEGIAHAQRVKQWLETNAQGQFFTS